MRRHGRCGAAGEGPYSNTDLGSGHGTHVAGIIAADSSSVKDGSRYGVAPDAHLACFAIGAVLFTTGRDGVRLHARPAAHVARQGVTVVFAAGNSGSENAQMSLNPFSQSLWVVSVAAGSVDRHRGDSSSNGLVSDNSRPVGITAGVTPRSPGTSMASPHVAGAAAVLKQAQPALTLDQVRLALQATATKVTLDRRHRQALPFLADRLRLREPRTAADFWTTPRGSLSAGPTAAPTGSRSAAASTSCG